MSVLVSADEDGFDGVGAGEARDRIGVEGGVIYEVNPEVKRTRSNRTISVCGVYVCQS